MRLALQQAAAAAPKRISKETMRRLLWIPILVVAAFAGYGTYALLAGR